MGDKPLKGIKVVDISTSYAGPFCSMILGDMGAEVIKVEKPEGGDDCRFWGPPFINGESAWFLSANRNKKSICINIRHWEGKEILDRLLKDADVFIENLKPSSLTKAGLDYETVSKINPFIIYCSISGFGLTGPLKHFPGYDLIAQAMSGMMSVTGEEGGRPQRVGTALSDITTGLIAAYCIVTSLYDRVFSKKGRLVDVSLLDTDVALMSPRIVSYLVSNEEPKPSGGTDSVISIYQSLRTADRDIVVCTGTNEIWKRFCHVLQRPEWVEYPKYKSNQLRKLHRVELVEQVEAILIQRPAEYWVKKMQEAQVPCAIIESLSSVVKNPQLIERGMITEIEHATAGKVRIVGSPWKLSDMDDEEMTPPPMLGEHTASILKELGVSDADILRLHKAGVIYERSLGEK